MERMNSTSSSPRPSRPRSCPTRVPSPPAPNGSVLQHLHLILHLVILPFGRRHLFWKQPRIPNRASSLRSVHGRHLFNVRKVTLTCRRRWRQEDEEPPLCESQSIQSTHQARKQHQHVPSERPRLDARRHQAGREPHHRRLHHIRPASITSNRLMHEIRRPIISHPFRSRNYHSTTPATVMHLSAVHDAARRQ